MVEGLEKTTARQELAVVVYDLTLLLIRLLLTALGAYAIQSQLRKADAADPDLDEARKKFYYAIAGYLLTILIGLFIPELPIFLFFAVAVFLLACRSALLLEPSSEGRDPQRNRERVPIELCSRGPAIVPMTREASWWRRLS